MCEYFFFSFLICSLLMHQNGANFKNISVKRVFNCSNHAYSFYWNKLPRCYKKYQGCCQPLFIVAWNMRNAWMEIIMKPTAAFIQIKIREQRRDKIKRQQQQQPEEKHFNKSSFICLSMRMAQILSGGFKEIMSTETKL